MPIVADTSVKRKKNLSKSAKSVIEAAISLLRQFPDGLIYPANANTKAPIFKKYNSVRRSEEELRHWLADFPRLVPAIIPISFGLLGIDVDDGESTELREALAENKLDFLAVASRSRGEHIYVRCKLAKSRMPGKWRAFGAGGDLRYGTNILLYGDAVLRLREFLGRPGKPISGAMRDQLIDGVAVTSQTAVGYDSVPLTHGRAVYMEELKNRPISTWPGAVAQLEGMKPAHIKPNEMRAVRDADRRRVSARAWAEARLEGFKYRGRISETYMAMVALATQGICWASHGTIAEVAGISERKSIRRHQERLVRDGLIVRMGDQGMSWRGKPTVVWDIIGFDGQTDP